MLGLLIASIIINHRMGYKIGVNDGFEVGIFEVLSLLKDKNVVISMTIKNGNDVERKASFDEMVNYLTKETIEKINDEMKKKS